MESKSQNLPIDLYNIDKINIRANSDYAYYELVFKMNDESGVSVLAMPKEFEKQMDEFVMKFIIKGNLK